MMIKKGKRKRSLRKEREREKVTQLSNFQLLANPGKSSYWPINPHTQSKPILNPVHIHPRHKIQLNQVSP